MCTETNVSLFWNWCEVFCFITINWTEMWAHCCYSRKPEFHFEIIKPQPNKAMCWASAKMYEWLECTVSHSKINNHKRTVLFHFQKHHCHKKERLNFCLFCYDSLQNGTVVYSFYAISFWMMCTIKIQSFYISQRAFCKHISIFNRAKNLFVVFFCSSSHSNCWTHFNIGKWVPSHKEFIPYKIWLQYIKFISLYCHHS